VKERKQMANIGTTTAFYKVETSLSRANSEVSKSMERLATGKQNANAGDRSSYVAMADTFRMDFVGTKLVSKVAQLLWDTLRQACVCLMQPPHCCQDCKNLQFLQLMILIQTLIKAIDLEAEALGDEFHRLMSTSKYKGKDIFVTTAGSEYVSMGGRNAEMTFGIGKVAYSNLYIHNWDTFATELGHANADRSSDCKLCS
jgi:flagellin-like hook-associated protein FlgL